MSSDSGPCTTAERLLARMLLALEEERLEPETWLRRQPEVLSDPLLAAEVLHLNEQLLVARGVLLPQRMARRWPRAPKHSSGDFIGLDFELIAFLGAGGMGEVWEAHDRRLGRSVALKLMRSESLGREGLERFSREARAGARLSHSGIAMTLEHRIDGDLAWIALELVPGGRTVRNLIAERSAAQALPPDHDRFVATLVAEIAEALAFAHARGVIHRDVKPGNILLTPEGRPKVTDFGLAQLMDETLTQGDVLGTYAYMSPEQVKAQKSQIDHRSDVFSLGVVLYELLTLRKPFQGDTQVQVAREILLEDPPDARAIRSRIPTDLAVIVAKCLEKDRNRRFQAMDDLAADLRRHLGNEPIRARPQTRVERLTKWARRHPVISVAGGLAAASFTAISLLLVSNLRANRELSKQRSSLEASNESLEAKSRESEQRRTDALRAKEEALESRAVVASLSSLISLVPKLQAMEANLYGDALNMAADSEGPLLACRQILLAFRQAELPLDDGQPVDDLIGKLQRAREVAPFAYSFAIDRIEQMADLLERPQLDCVRRFCGGTFERPVSEKRRPTWERWCSEFSDLIDFLPRLDALLDALTEDPWRRRVWTAYRARRRDLKPWSTELLEDTPETAEDLRFLGLKLAGDPDRNLRPHAARLLEASEAEQPGEFWTNFNLCLWKADRSSGLYDPTAAIEHGYRATAARPNHYLAWSNLGATLLEVHSPEEALYPLKRAVALDQNDAAAQTNLGLALLDLDRNAEALHALDRSVELEPSAIRYLNRAHGQRALGELAAAETDLRMAVRLDPKYAKAWALLGSVLVSESRDEEAAQAYDTALSLAPLTIEQQEEYEALRLRVQAR